MAGRPAAGPTTGILVGLFVSIGIMLIAIVLLVVLWTKQEDLSLAASRARQEGERVMTSGERQREFKAWFDTAQGAKSVTRLMHDEMSGMAEILTSDAADVVPGYVSHMRIDELQPLWDRMSTDGVLEQPAEIVELPTIDALKSLYGIYSDQHRLLVQAQERIDDLSKERDQLEAARAEQQKQFDNTVAELRSRVESFEQEWQKYREEKQGVIDDSMQANSRLAKAADKAAQALRGEIEALHQELDKQAAKNEELQDKVRDFQIVPQPRMAARQSDGEILMAKPGEDSVFVNLGHNDHLTLGLVFAVYPPESGIPNTGKAKAQIEVVNIGDEVSQCRIKWVDAMNPIIKGDVIANPIYDKTRSLSFVVIGEYDLDYDGRDDPNGPGVIKAVVQEMGGTITDTLSARTDFVIVGARPLVNRLGSDPSPEEEAVHKEQLAEAKRFDGMVEEGKALSIPMMTQETFLNFMGRRPRTTVAASSVE